MPSTPGVALASPSAAAVAAGAPSSSIFLHAESASGSTRARNRAEAVRGENVIGDSSKDVKQFDVENQRCVGADRPAGGAGGAVALRAGDPEAVFRSFLHQGHALGPAGDDLSEREFGRLVAILGTVEHGTVKQGAVVVNA